MGLTNYLPEEKIQKHLAARPLAGLLYDVFPNERATVNLDFLVVAAYKLTGKTHSRRKTKQALTTLVRSGKIRRLSKKGAKNPTYALAIYETEDEKRKRIFSNTFKILED